MGSSRVALVTGGAGGIGGAISRQLAREGHQVVVADLSRDGAERVADEIGGTAVTFDVTDPESVVRGIAEVEQALGPIAVLVNCAGWDELRPFTETDEPFRAKVLEINLAGPIRVTRQLLPGMIEARAGRVVNIASDAGRVGSSLESVYSAAKGGLIAFTKTIAREVARYGITANTVCPGPTDTPLLAGITQAGGDAERIIASMTRAVPMRRLGRPEEVAAAAVFLASDEAGYITGQTLSVSGGLTMA